LLIAPNEPPTEERKNGGEMPTENRSAILTYLFAETGGLLR
jgi:hypothetical protein